MITGLSNTIHATAKYYENSKHSEKHDNEIYILKTKSIYFNVLIFCHILWSVTFIIQYLSGNFLDNYL